jgi:hypothetical protein
MHANGYSIAVAKIFGEKAALDFAKENNIALVTVLPSLLLDPVYSMNYVLHTASDIHDLFQAL